MRLDFIEFKTLFRPKRLVHIRVATVAMTREAISRLFWLLLLPPASSLNEFHERLRLPPGFHHESCTQRRRSYLQRLVNSLQVTAASGLGSLSLALSSIFIFFFFFYNWCLQDQYVRHRQGNWRGTKIYTSSWRSPWSSVAQSSSRNLSVASTTQIKESVFSK